MAACDSRVYPLCTREDRHHSIPPFDNGIESPRQVSPEYPSRWAAITAVAQKLGIGTAETPRKWVRRGEIDDGRRPRLTSEEHAEIKRLKRENAELRRANPLPMEH